MDYTDITKADIQEKLDALGVKYTTRDTKDDLIAKLEGANESTPTESSEVESEEVKAEKVVDLSTNEFELARNVKYRGVYYKAGDSIKLDESDVQEFKNKELIK